jgi:hypothetical protein
MSCAFQYVMHSAAHSVTPLPLACTGQPWPRLIFSGRGRASRACSSMCSHQADASILSYWLPTSKVWNPDNVLPIVPSCLEDSPASVKLPVSFMLVGNILRFSACMPILRVHTQTLPYLTCPTYSYKCILNNLLIFS